MATQSSFNNSPRNTMSLEEMKVALEKEGQSHLLKYWDCLDQGRQQQLLNQLNTIKVDGISGLFQQAMKSVNEVTDGLDTRMKPIPRSQYQSEERCSEEVLENYRNAGFEKIAEGRVAVLLLAGGQGTRLGVAHPKGMYSVGLKSNKTLLQIQAERIRRLESLAWARVETGKPGRITWYIMTSGPTHTETKEYLEKNNYFGLNPEYVIIFKQGLLPCFDFDGNILLDQQWKISESPDGNGGVYRALSENRILEDMQKRGLHYIHVHSVDNILVKVADPVFIGYCVLKNSDCGAKVVRKAEASEAVGVVCQVDDIFQVVEYSEITKETANKRDDQGNLLFSAGNICNHFFTTEFLIQVASKYEKQMKLHVAKKKIPFIDASGNRVSPITPNGIKIEKFVFDVFQFSKNFVTWEVPRDSEFSALKNSDEAGKDCPSTARSDLWALHKKYLEKAGAIVKTNEVEISPLVSYDGESLEDLVKGKVFDSAILLS